MMFDRKNHETILFSCNIGSTCVILFFYFVVILIFMLSAGDYKGCKILPESKLIHNRH
jgi:hypothetical protein